MRTRTAPLLLTAALLLGACGSDLEVVQGQVVSYDATARILLVRDELSPNATVALSVEAAEVGADPAPGDIVRIAYREQDGRRRATRVMNITRQTELRKGGSGGH